jgi:hypothetical protein
MTRVSYLALCTVTVWFLVLFVSRAASAEQPGTWVREDGTTVQVPCPSPDRQADPAITVRLPAGCVVATGRIGYTPAQDAKARDELAALRAQVPLLAAEIARGRSAFDAEVARLTGAVSAERAQADAQRDRREKAETALLLTQQGLSAARVERAVWGAVAAVVGAAAGLTIGVLVAR